jgi:hypothetical protein
MAGQTSPTLHRFPWEKLYTATVLADNARLRERIEAVRGVLLVRLLDLTDSVEHEGELKAVEDGLRTLAALKRERLING